MTQLELKATLQQPYHFNTWKPILKSMFNNVELFTKYQEIGQDKKLFKNGRQLGYINFGQEDIALFEVEVADSINIARNRKQLRDIATSYIDQSVVHGALVWYYSQNQSDYRLSFIQKYSEFDENGQLLKKETAPKRYTFTLGSNESCTTASMRILELRENKDKNTLADISKAFSVDKLNTDFFNRYKEFYTLFYNKLCENPKWAVEVFGIPKEKVNEEAARKPMRDFIKKMMGRIVFLHFLQKKGWMGCPAELSEWKDGDKEFMLNLYKNSKDKSQFYSKCLVELFFNTLNNSDRTNDIFTITGTRVPYLNGGLFDEDFPKARRIDFPEKLFGDLMEFFAQYNFTIDENSPEEQEVGIDPEMLGHIFENLLEDNKEKGAFYTPKEIVHYMCQESLIEYLKTNIPDLKDAQGLERFIKIGDIGDRSNKHNEVVKRAKQIEELLDKVKVCDPAIGSGAFPMGMLHEIFKAKLALDLTLDRAKAKKDIIQNSIYGVDIEKGAVDIARLRFWLSLVVDEDEPQPLPNLDFKIMQGNSLLESFEGIDLSQLNKEEEFITTKTGQLEFGGEFSAQSTSMLLFDKMDKSELQNLIDSYFDFEVLHNQKYQHKKEIKARINNIIESKLLAKFYLDKKKEERKLDEYKNLLRCNQVKASDTKGFAEKKRKNTLKIEKQINAQQAVVDRIENCIITLQNIEGTNIEKPYFLWHTYFKDVFEQGGFDIVIGNPPYLRIQGIRDSNPLLADEYEKLYKSATGSYDLYALFTEKAVSIINEKGVVNFIMPVKWTNSSFGKGLRSIIAQDHMPYKIINFGSFQVFNASTYTGLHWFKKDCKFLNYLELTENLKTNEDLNKYFTSLSDNSFHKIATQSMNDDTWVLSKGSVMSILDKLNKQPRRIRDIFDKIFQGLATSKDDVYFLYDCIVENDCVIGYSKQISETIKIERGLVKPLLKGEDVHRYDDIKTNRVVIFPYKLENNTATLYTEEEISSEFPQGYKYLKRCETILRGREKGRFNIDHEWFQYGRKQGIISAEKEKLVAPEISKGSNFSYDKKGEFYSTTTIYGYIKKVDVTECYKCFLAILNSQLFWWYLVNTGTTLANGYFRFMPHYTKSFPIPIIPKNTEHELVNLVDKILKRKEENSSSICSDLEEQIDKIVYELYGLSTNDIEVIER
jgi:hypothetical protein